MRVSVFCRIDGVLLTALVDLAAVLLFVNELARLEVALEAEDTRSDRVMVHHTLEQPEYQWGPFCG